MTNVDTTLSANGAERRLKECGEILEEFADHVYQAGGAP